MNDQPGHSRDTLFASPIGDVEAFRFNEAVVEVFPDMLRRSIPGYESIIRQSGLLAARFVQPHSHVYDFGCSLGATLFAMREALAAEPPARRQGIQLTGIDKAPAMIRRARELLNLQTAIESSEPMAVQLLEADLEQHELAPASVVALNFTLQFVRPAARDALIQRIARSLLPGGVLILSEKIRFDNPDIEQLNTELYHRFKAFNGYSALEISQKRTALENVLITDTLEQHHQRLQNAGFNTISVWFQCFNFMSLVAIRPAVGEPATLNSTS